MKNYEVSNVNGEMKTNDSCSVNDGRMILIFNEIVGIVWIKAAGFLFLGKLYSTLEMLNSFSWKRNFKILQYAALYWKVSFGKYLGIIEILIILFMVLLHSLTFRFAFVVPVKRCYCFLCCYRPLTLLYFPVFQGNF